MDEKSKKQLVVVVLLLVPLFLLVGRNMGGCARRPATQPAAAQPAAAPSATVQTPPPPSPQRVERVRKLELLEWGRNPFQVEMTAKPLPVRVGPVKRTVVAAAAPLFKLEGIVWDEQNPYAIINGELRAVGDSVFFYEIIEIKRDKVTLKKGDEVVDLRMFPEVR